MRCEQHASTVKTQQWLKLLLVMNLSTHLCKKLNVLHPFLQNSLHVLPMGKDTFWKLYYQAHIWFWRNRTLYMQACSFCRTIQNQTYVNVAKKFRRKEVPRGHGTAGQHLRETGRRFCVCGGGEHENTRSSASERFRTMTRR